MSLEFNADKQYIKSSRPYVLGTEEFTVRSGTGTDEKEVFRVQLDPTTALPRVGINRTGRKVESIRVNANSGGSGYLSAPSVTIGPPDLATGTQALASSIISNGSVVSFVISNSGDGYLTPPSVSLGSGGGGSGAAATAFLDTVDYELDINGAIRTSTSIISDTARILNLDIDNFVTPDADFRAPYLKLYTNGTGTQFVPNVSLTKGEFRYYGDNIYRANNTGVTGTTPPVHTSDTVLNGAVQLEHVGYRVNSQNLPHYGVTGDGVFPRSITPVQGDRSNKIATTEYVLNLATNDVGGRVYVSQSIGSDLNDGRSAVAPVRTIKKACQIASTTVGVKETIVISGGDYTEDNPISLPPDCSIVGDNLRLVLIRPANPRKHMFKLSDKNYINGVTFRDQVDSNGDSIFTWDYAVTFDDKQRLYYDVTTGGDYGRNLPVGHQIFGVARVRVTFQNHTGSNNLLVGEEVRGVNTGSLGIVKAINFNSITGPSAYTSGTVDIQVTSGSFNSGETFEYEVGSVPNTVTYEFVSTDIISIRAEGEVVSNGKDLLSSLPIVRVDGSLINDPNVGGVIFYTNPLLGRTNFHDFKEGQEIEITGLPSSSPNLSMFNGKQRIYKIIRDSDGKARRFVIPKDVSGTFTSSNYQPVNASVKSYSYYVTLTLLNSPNKFSETPYVDRRYQDACNLIRNNIPFIKDEAYLQTLAEFSFFTPPNETKCRRDIGHFVEAIIRDLEYGGNYHTIEAAQRYIQGTQIGYIGNEITETIRAFDIARRLCILAMRNWRTGNGGYSQPVYTPLYSSVARYFDLSVTEDTAGAGSGGTCANVKSAIDTLGYLFVDVIANNAADRYLDSSYLIARNDDFIAEEALGYTLAQYPTLGLSSGDQTKCKRDIKYTLRALRRDLTLGGNAGIVAAGAAYYTGNTLNGIPSSELVATRYAFQKAKDLAILAMRNFKTGVNGDGPVYTPLYSSTALYTDGTITVDPNTPICNNIASAITTSYTTLDNIFANSGTLPTITYGTLYNVNSLITYPENTIYDADNRRITPRAVWDDLPIIEASPYIQNSSIISFLGGNGCEVDGAKVTQPNSPFPGLELDGSASYPNQGKSMVASAFTIVSFGGTGYKVINDGYTQLVSVFVIFCADGIFCDTGGYASVTNSATNFGNYALRAVGYRDEAYSFDVGTIVNVSETPTGRTIFRVDGLGREPLEHYIVKIDGYENQNTSIEYFVETVGGVTVGPPFSANVTLDSAASFRKLSNSQVFSPPTGAEFNGKTIRLHRPSIVNSSSHTWEFAGSGTNYNALPENGGTKIEAYEQVSEDYGRVYTSGTDELGDFKVGYFAKIENRTGAITFTGTVTISEVEFLKLKGGDVVVTGFSADNTLGGATSTNSQLPTQKAVKDYISNNLGPYINKPYSTNAVPRALVELTDSGKISIDQIPALRPFSVYTVANTSERLALEGALAGDIAIQQDTSTSYILNNDLASQYLAFAVNTNHAFTVGNIFTGSGTGGQIQSTEYREGVVYQINITNSGSGYTSAPTVTITAPQQSGGVSATAVATIANGQVVTLKITLNNGYVGGKGYTSQPSVNIAAPGGGGTAATAVALIESRLYGNIVNDIKIIDTDDIYSNNTPTPTLINLTRVINTSATDANNWVSLSSNQIAASDITSGVIATTRLASNSTEANSFTFLRGDQSYAPVLQSLKGTEVRYFAKTSTTSNSGSSTLLFAGQNDGIILKGHTISSSISGIAPNTVVSSVSTASGTTTVSLNNPLTSQITTGTIIEFGRPESPLILNTTYTVGNFIDSVIIVNGGSGFTSGSYFNITLAGGSGTGLKVNIVVAGGSVTEITVIDGGRNYTADFAVSATPSEIGSGSGLSLAAKLNTALKNYANTAVDIKRVTDATISSDQYGTAGVARFRKSQFNIGVLGNGSVELKTGADSGLDADLLDGAQGSFYTNAGNLSSGIVPTDRLSGTYNIAVSGQSGNTLRLITSTNNPTSSPSPNAFSEGIIADTRNNAADELSDGGTRHLVLTLRNGASGFDATFGGVRQLAFTDNDNMWIRGSGTNVTTFGTWAKVWTSLNDGSGTGLDADILDGRQGRFYQDARNINYGILSERKLPAFQTARSFQNSATVRSVTNKPYYSIYVSGQILNSAPFLVGNQGAGNTGFINLYNANSQATGTIQTINVTTYNDNDNTLDYTIITGVLDSGTFDGAETIGTASIRFAFQDYAIDVDGTYEVAKLESITGTAVLKLGRKDGTASSPAIYFNTSSSPATNYNVRIEASGGSATDGSGSLNVTVIDNNAFKINNNTIWNAGNIVFASNNVASAAVQRDASGNFSAGTITASLTGAASLNVLKSGDTMTGSLIISGASSNLSVGGTLGVTGNTTLTANLTVDTNTLFVDATNDSVNIGTTTHVTGYKLNVSGQTRLSVSTGDVYVYFANATATTGRNYYLQNAGTASEFQLWDATAGSKRWAVTSSGHFVPGQASTLDIGTSANRWRDVYTVNENVKTSVTIGDASGNTAAPIVFLGSSTTRNFRIGNQLAVSNAFEITPSTANGGSTFTTPGLLMSGSGNVGVGVASVNDTYKLEIGGSINFTGTLFQNGVAYVTSRWTQSPNGTDIGRASNVGINKTSNPNYNLDVAGTVGMTGILYANGDKQWLDTYGVFKANRNTIAESITIPANTNAMTAGPITINNGYTITIQDGASWSVV
jgi:hypothetical protein